MDLGADGAVPGGVFLRRAILGTFKHSGRERQRDLLAGSCRKRLLYLPYSYPGYAHLAGIVEEEVGERVKVV